MQRSEPQISDYMMKAPRSVHPGSSLKKALNTMTQSGSHYLPVLSGKRVVGLLKDHSPRFAASLLGSEATTVGDLMSPAPAVAGPGTSLYEVLDNTPDNVYGCTIVQDSNGKIVGLFTPREALAAIHDLATKNSGKK
ncbi:MAG: CBS domain-containing protein [Deltaproteobacteria bacterium]|nr:CBS domain-containing protein [Deltaproteobacteria bacterium]MBI3294965.1 CBS domain-containing protein [Deltaproteobacteria bacterium]